MRKASRPARDAPPVGDAYDAAVRYLGSRPRSVSEIRRHLRTKRFDDEAQGKAIEQLRAQRYIDDEAFARYWVEQRLRFRPKGDRALVSELMQKGIARETIDLVIGEADPNAETERARAAIRRPMTRWLAMDDRERKRKIQQYLGARGFGYDVIEEVIGTPESQDE
jgi:regulatory protein